jgi:hypothetical protein
MDSADDLEIFNSSSENECDKPNANVPKNLSNHNTNIVHKLFNREVS